MSHQVEFYRRAFWLPDASEVEQILATLLGAPPWSVCFGEDDAASVADPHLVAILLESDADTPRRLLPAELQHVTITAHGRTLGLERRWAEIDGEGSGLVLRCSPVPAIADTLRSLAETLSADYVLVASLPDASDAKSAPATQAFLPALQAANATLDGWPALRASSDGWFRPADGSNKDFDGEVREVARLVGLGRLRDVAEPRVRAVASALASSRPMPAVAAPAVTPQPVVAAPSYLLSKQADLAKRQPDALEPRSTSPAIPPPTYADPFAAPASTYQATGTEEVDFAKLRDLVLAKPTPFAGSTSPERLAELRAEAEATDETVMTKAVVTGDEDPDETMMLAPSAAMRAHLAEPLPFAPAFPELDVERYATLYAELQVRGATDDVLGRYRVKNVAALAMLQAEQDRRFAADASLRNRFEQRVAHYLSFMRPGSPR